MCLRVCVSVCLCVFPLRSYDEPAIEDLYRMEQELNRVGKTRAEGKIKPLRVDVVERIKIADFNMEVSVCVSGARRLLSRAPAPPVLRCVVLSAPPAACCCWQ